MNARSSKILGLAILAGYVVAVVATLSIAMPFELHLRGDASLPTSVLVAEIAAAALGHLITVGAAAALVAWLFAISADKIGRISLRDAVAAAGIGHWALVLLQAFRVFELARLRSACEAPPMECAQAAVAIVTQPQFAGTVAVACGALAVVVAVRSWTGLNWFRIAVLTLAPVAAVWLALDFLTRAFIAPAR